MEILIPAREEQGSEAITEQQVIDCFGNVLPFSVMTSLESVDRQSLVLIMNLPQVRTIICCDYGSERVRTDVADIPLFQESRMRGGITYFGDPLVVTLKKIKDEGYRFNEKKCPIRMASPKTEDRSTHVGIRFSIEAARHLRAKLYGETKFVLWVRNMRARLLTLAGRISRKHD